jgi:hypothetical protein
VQALAVQTVDGAGQMQAVGVVAGQLTEQQAPEARDDPVPDQGDRLPPGNGPVRGALRQVDARPPSPACTV